MEKRISNWMNKFLSFAGRLQLIISVLSALHVYWSSVFIIPARIISDLEAKMRGFLWSQGTMSRGKAKVSWKTVCVPKYEGGLGIRRIADLNKALMINHIWSIITDRDSLWVKWIHTYRLKNQSFWAVRVPDNCCWSWRKILQLRSVVRNFFWSELGDGSNTFAWYDNWCSWGSLDKLLTPRMIANGGFSLKDKVKDIWVNNQIAWPSAWVNIYPILNTIRISINYNARDRIWWRVGNENHEFSAYSVWQAIRPREEEVDWGKVIWSSHCVPRHAFLMWLVMRGKLLTQDKILGWDFARRKTMNMMCCLLCYENIDSHSHLFFECKFSSRVWLLTKKSTSMRNIKPVWSDIVTWLINHYKAKSIYSILDRLVVAATAYFIWQERNNRSFMNHARPPDCLAEVILSSVRYKLMSLKLKKTGPVQQILKEWKIYGEDIYDSHG
ncbi:hypothetical protein QVD17_16800 [Tagetes erecta]|uniref:Reverse transcriptase zinc-binding domain-containing protein n=1 Tax=Tagetes erecta TaxID=13708 RepID=A0AAD8P0U5_TARER|nr:hypothetical protein QVD17_16800 [Tagetes erecta]